MMRGQIYLRPASQLERDMFYNLQAFQWLGMI